LFIFRDIEDFHAEESNGFTSPFQGRIGPAQKIKHVQGDKTMPATERLILQGHVSRAFSLLYLDLNSAATLHHETICNSKF
jgi:hypothetical protein